MKGSTTDTGYITCTTYKPIMSARFRVDPRDRHPSGLTSPPLNRLGVETLDEKIQNIEALTEAVQDCRATLDCVLSQFIRLTAGENGTLETALTQLKSLLGTHQWRLERPKRYQMSLILASVDKNVPVAKLVLLFNELNILCSQTIKKATELKELVKQFRSDSSSTSPSYLSGSVGSPADTADRTLYLMDALRDLGEDEINQRITEVRHRKMNENSARRIEQETENILIEMRKLFQSLVQACSVCLV